MWKQTWQFLCNDLIHVMSHNFFVCLFFGTLRPLCIFLVYSSNYLYFEPKCNEDAMSTFSLANSWMMSFPVREQHIEGTSGSRTRACKNQKKKKTCKECSTWPTVFGSCVTPTIKTTIVTVTITRKAVECICIPTLNHSYMNHRQSW